MILMIGSNKANLMIGGNVTRLTKFGNAFVNSVIVFFMIGSVSAILAVFVHSVLFMPAWTSFVLGSFALLFITMLALEYSMERDDDQN